ncbi:hypothetical protein VMCG_07901 [Cytospora schulzeri]|uniref:Uncharacterized protein n=1 Tax=Cytospora schulzeri TaxID=448051 RepID=A0A423W0H5_9PEZI|nr:hypothetical protein VMCG_07901 [Valsa malicola]
MVMLSMLDEPMDCLLRYGLASLLEEAPSLAWPGKRSLSGKCREAVGRLVAFEYFQKALQPLVRTALCVASSGGPQPPHRYVATVARQWPAAHSLPPSQQGTKRTYPASAFPIDTRVCMLLLECHSMLWILSLMLPYISHA